MLARYSTAGLRRIAWRHRHRGPLGVTWWRASSSLSDILADIASEERLCRDADGDDHVAGETSKLLCSDDDDREGHAAGEKPKQRKVEEELGPPWLSGMLSQTEGTASIALPRRKFAKELKASPSSLSFLLSDITSDAQSRRAFVKELRTIAAALSLPQWNPNSRGTLANLGITLTPSHVKELMRGLSDPVWALRVYIWASRQPGYHHDSSTRSSIAAMWPDNELLEPFLDLLSTMNSLERLPMTPDSYLLLIKGFCWAEMHDVASGTLNQMRRDGFGPNVAHFNLLMYAFVQANRVTCMRDLYDQMHVDGVMPDFVTCNLRVRGCCRARQVDEAFKAFFQTLKKGFIPDLGTFGELMDCMCKAGKAHHVYILVVKMHEHGFFADVSIFHAIIEGLCRNGCTEDAVRLVKQIRRKGVEPTEAVCNILVTGFCRERKMVNSQAYISYMLKKGFLPEPEVFNLVLIVLFKERKLREVFLIVDKVISKGFAPNVSSYNILIYGLSKHGQVQKALEAWNILLQFCLPSQKAYCALLQGLCRTGRLSDAVKVFKLAMAKGGVGDVLAHDVLLYKLKQTGRVKEFQECSDLLPRRTDTSEFVDIFEGLNMELRRMQCAHKGAGPAKFRVPDVDCSSEESSLDDD